MYLDRYTCVMNSVAGDALENQRRNVPSEAKSEVQYKDINEKVMDILKVRHHLSELKEFQSQRVASREKLNF